MVGVLAAGIALLIPISLIFARNRVHTRMTQRVEQIQKQGFPTSGTELNGWPAPPGTEENRAEIITGALSKIVKVGTPAEHATEVARLLRTNLWNAADLKFAEEVLTKNGEVFAELRHGVGGKWYRYPVDYSEGLGTLLPHLYGIKTAAQLLALKAAHSSGADMPGLWSDDVETILLLGETLNEERNLIGFMVRVALVGIASNAVERHLQTGKAARDEDYARLQERFASFMSTNLLPMALVGERAMSIPIFRDVRELHRYSQQRDLHWGDGEDERQNQTMGSGWSVLSMIGFWDRDANYYMETMDEAIKLASLQPPESLALGEYMARRGENARRKFYVFSGMLTSALGRTTEKDALLRAEAGMTMTALGIERFRMANHRLPEKLDDLVPKFLKSVPIDPFDSQPLRFVRRESGYTLYSVDTDRMDDGGADRPPKKTREASDRFDLLFKVDRAARN